MQDPRCWSPDHHPGLVAITLLIKPNCHSIATPLKAGNRTAAAVQQSMCRPGVIPVFERSFEESLSRRSLNSFRLSQCRTVRILFRWSRLGKGPPGPIPLILETAMAGGHRIWRERLAIHRNSI